MKAIIIDDERLARQELKHLLKKHSETINIVAEASNGIEGIKAIKKHSPDIVFLDIQMPEMDGFEMLKQLEEIPKVIFITAYDEYAIDAFKFNALDYLLKPVDPLRLADTLEKIKEENEDEFFSLISNSREERKLNHKDRVFIKDGEKCYFPYLEDIRYFESQGNYVRVFFKDNRPMILRSLNALEERLSPEDFFRANRKYLINLRSIENIENWFNGGLKVKLTDQTEIEISRRQAIRFKDIMSI
jgi:two-component system LytT family response regulator